MLKNLVINISLGFCLIYWFCCISFAIIISGIPYLILLLVDKIERSKKNG